MILTMTKYHENLLRDSPLSLLSIVKFSFSLETNMILKIPNETFLKITRYLRWGKKGNSSLACAPHVKKCYIWIRPLWKNSKCFHMSTMIEAIYDFNASTLSADWHFLLVNLTSAHKLCFLVNLASALGFEREIVAVSEFFFLWQLRAPLIHSSCKRLLSLRATRQKRRGIGRLVGRYRVILKKVSFGVFSII